MEFWNDLDRERSKHMRQRRALIAGLLLLLVACCFLAYAFWQAATGTDDVGSDITAASMVLFPQASSSQVVSQAAAADRPSLTLFTKQQDDPTMSPDRFIYLHQATDMPTFTRQQQQWPAGPQAIQLGLAISQTHQLGVAALTAPSRPGAAAEWSVPVWFRPAWIPDTVDCGRPGTAAVVGHTSWYGQPGPFANLSLLTVGEQIRCQAQSGQWYTYEVTQAVRVPYEDTRFYWQDPINGEYAVLSLISCTPALDGIVVVRAVLLERPS